MKLSPPFPLRKGALTIGVVIVLTWLFLYTQADLIFGQYAGPTKDIMLLYFLIFMIPAVIAQKGLPGAKEGLKSIFPFAAMIVLTLAIAIPMQVFVTAASLEWLTLALGFGLLYSFVKAYIEEVTFRYYLPKYFLGGGLRGDIISSVIFGIFHLQVAILAGIQAPGFAIIGLMFMGFMWSLVRRLFQSQGDGAGIMAATGSHFAYNLVALGLIML